MGLERPCGERGPPRRVNVHQKCIQDHKIIVCNGTQQEVSQPCNGKCPTVKLEEIGFYELEHRNLSAYVLCGSECLRRDRVWECKGGCQPYSVPCDGHCYFNHKFNEQNGHCIKNDLGWLRPSGGIRPLYTGPGTSVKLISSRTFYKSLTECPNLHCKTESGCCLLTVDQISGKTI